MSHPSQCRGRLCQDSEKKTSNLMFLCFDVWRFSRFRRDRYHTYIWTFQIRKSYQQLQPRNDTDRSAITDGTHRVRPRDTFTKVPRTHSRRIASLPHSAAERAHRRRAWRSAPPPTARADCSWSALRPAAREAHSTAPSASGRQLHPGKMQPREVRRTCKKEEGRQRLEALGAAWREARHLSAGRSRSARGSPRGRSPRLSLAARSARAHSR